MHADNRTTAPCHTRVNHKRTPIAWRARVMLAFVAVTGAAVVGVTAGSFTDVNCPVGTTCWWSEPSTWASPCCYPHSTADTATLYANRTVLINHNMTAPNGAGRVHLDQMWMQPQSAVVVVGSRAILVNTVSATGGAGPRRMRLDTDALGAGTFAPSVTGSPFLTLEVANAYGTTSATPCGLDLFARGSSANFPFTDAVFHANAHLRLVVPPTLPPANQRVTFGAITQLLGGGVTLTATGSNASDPYVYPVLTGVLRADLNAAAAPSLTINSTAVRLEVTATEWPSGVVDSGDIVVPGGVHFVGSAPGTCAVMCRYLAPASVGVGCAFPQMSAAPTIQFGESAPNAARSAFRTNLNLTAGGSAAFSATDVLASTNITARGLATVRLDSASTLQAGSIALHDSAQLLVAGPNVVVSGGAVTAAGDNARVNVTGGCTVTTGATLTASGSHAVMEFAATDFSGTATLSGAAAVVSFRASTFRGTVTASGAAANVKMADTTVVGTAAVVRLTGSGAKLRVGSSGRVLIPDGSRLRVSPL